MSPELLFVPQVECHLFVTLPFALHLMHLHPELCCKDNSEFFILFTQNLFNK